MKTLFLKELREHLSSAAMVLLLSLAVVVGTQWYYTNLINDAASSGLALQNYYYRLQPLTSPNFEMFSTLLCIAAPLGLGWRQIFRERQRDAWAFLVHRPVTRTTIFLGKVAAGLTIYVVMVGLPLLYFVWWVKTPGDVAAPFEWGMAAPLLWTFIGGVAWYFAGMLTSVRQARWYGSRALGYGAALVTMEGFAANFGHGWWAVLAMAALVVAVWGAFHNQGRFQGQPALGKAALTLALVPGTTLVFLIVIALGLAVTVGVKSSITYPEYRVGRDGVIYRLVETNGVVDLVSLDSRVLMDTNTGRAMDLNTFNHDLSLAGLSVSMGQKSYGGGFDTSWFQFLTADRQTLWFGVNSESRIVGYDLRTRRLVGSVGPGGFANTEQGDGSRFLSGNQWVAYPGQDASRLCVPSDKTIYRVDLKKGEILPLWTATNDDVIEAYGANIFNTDRAMVVTRQKVVLLDTADSSARVAWSVALPPNVKDYHTITLYGRFERGRQEELTGGPSRASYSLWISPNTWSEPTKPHQVFQLSAQGEIMSREELPVPQTMTPHWQLVNTLISSAMPPVVYLLPHGAGGVLAKAEVYWGMVRWEALWTGVSLVAALWLCQRYGFTGSRRAGWLVFVLLFGLPGLLAFVAVQEWPAREECPKCHRLRVVENAACEHCGGAFQAPKRNGTEIFEAVGTVLERG